MKYFTVYYTFRMGINGPTENRETEVVFDDVEPGTTDRELKRMAEREVNQRFERSEDYPLYGKFWQVTEVKQRIY